MSPESEPRPGLRNVIRGALSARFQQHRHPFVVLTVPRRKRLEELFVPFPTTEMEAVEVSRRVNSPANDDPGCLDPAIG